MGIRVPAKPASWEEDEQRNERAYEDEVGGYRNLYRPVSYRTAGGCCVCSREMEDGGIKHYNMYEICRNVLQCILQCPLKMLYVSLERKSQYYH